MNIRQIRAQYPQYSDLSDKQLADALHAKFYSDLPIQDYYSRIGFAPERTWGETATDIGAALVSGAGGLAQFPGQVVGLLPGMRGLGETLAAPGEALKTYGEGLKSQGLKAREALRSKALSEAEKNGVLAEFATAIKETIKDPALLSTFLAEQVPMLIGPGGAAKVTTMLGKGTVEAATAGAAREAAAKALGAKATAAAVGTGAVMQGADIGEETYKEAFKIAKARGMSDEDAQRVALAKARVAALEAGALSVAAQRLPGGKAIERRLAGLPGEGRIRGALGEALSEAIEEGGGAFAKNIGLQELDPTRSLTAGIGTAAGLGALGGAGLGAVLGGHRAEAPPPGAPAEAPIERTAREAQAAAPAAAPTPEVPPVEPAVEPAPVAPPAAEAPPPAETIPEPEVVKKGAPPPTGLQPEDLTTLGLKKKQPLYKRMLGKDMGDPAQRDAALADIENYLVKGHGSEESRASLTAFKERFAPAAEPAPTETPSVPTAAPVEQPSGASPAVAGEPVAGAAPGGAGVTEPTGVVPTVADVTEPAGREGQQPAAVEPIPAPAPTKTTEAPALTETIEAPAPVAAPKQKVLKGSVANRVKALGVNAAVGGVPDPKIVRETLEPIDPKMARAVMFYLGVDYDGNFLVGVNNLPQTPSAQKAAEMAGLGENSGDRVKKVATALGITGDIRRKYQAEQTGQIVTGVASESSQSRVSQEANTGKLIKNQLWYQPIARKGISGANDTELVRAIDKASRLLNNPANKSVYAELTAEFEKRAKRPEFAAAAKRQLGIGTETVTVEEGTSGTEDAIDEDIAELPQRPTPGVASPGITRAVNRGDTRRALQAIRETPEATPLDHEVAQRLLGLGQFLGFPKIETRPKDQIKGSGQYNPSSDTASIAAGEEDTHTVLHEVTHAFVHKLIVANEKGLRNDAGYRDLKQLYDYLKKTYPALEKEYGMSSVTEFASEAMSNPQFQKKLGTIRYKTRAAWSQFVQAVRKLLKIGAGDSSALVEAMAGVDSLLRIGREYQKTGPDIGAGTVSVITPEAEAAAQGVDVIGEQKAAKPMSGNPAIKARIRVANNMAGLMDAFTKWYGGDVRTAMGRLNPTVLFSRALDADRISVEAQLIGGLKKVDGLIVATELTDADGKPVLGADGKPLSYKNVVARIADAAKKSKKPYEEYLKVIDTVLYGHREFNIRKNNELIEQQAQALEAAGKKAEAKKLREEIATLAIKDPKKLDELETEFQKDDFIKGISNDLDTIRFNFIDMLVDTGRISKEVAQEWKDNEGYIPFKRVQDYTDAFDEVGSSRRGVGATRNIKRFEGSTRMSTSVVENFSSLLDWATGEAMRNEARTRALQDMVLMGAAKPGGKPDFDAPGGVQDTFEDGVRKSYYVPDPMLMIGFGMQPYQMSGVVKALNRYGTRVLRAGVTSMPPFAIKQVFDDIVRGYTFAGVKDNIGLTKNALLNFPKNWINELFKKELFKTTKGQTNIKELRKLGIVATFDLSREGNIKDVMVEAGAKKESLFHAILRVMEAGAKASDISVRQAIYSQVLKETGDVAKAESAAREIINFSYQGSSDRVRMVASVVPFFNAYAQGMDKLATAAAGKVVGQTTGVARSMFYTRMMYLTALGLAYAVMMQDDDDYQALPDHVRDTHWIIPKVKINGQPVGIPVAPDLAFFFKAIPERAVRYLKYQGTDEERAALDVVSELFVRGYDVFSPPNVTPQLIRPVFENIINYSFFLGRPLESQTQLRMRPFLRYGVGTSDTMKAVSEILEDAANATGVEAFAISPIKLENAVRGLLGTTGGLALSMADMMINPDRTDRPLHQQLSSQLTGASAVLKNPVGTKYMDEIYSLEKKAEQAYTTYNRLLETAPEKADKFLEDNIGMYSIRDAVQGVMESIRSLNDTAKLIDRDTSMSPEERRKAIDELRAQQNDIARQVYMLRKQAMNIQLGL